MKKWKNITKNHLICVKHKGKTVKEVKMHNFLDCACKSQNVAQSQKNFVRSHDRETVTFRNSDSSSYYYPKEPQGVLLFFCWKITHLYWGYLKVYHKLQIEEDILFQRRIRLSKRLTLSTKHIHTINTNQFISTSSSLYIILQSVPTSPKFCSSKFL